MQSMTMEDIDRLIEPYAGEWVLIDLLEMDDSTTMPTKAEVIAHSSDRERIYALDRQLNKRTLVTYSPTPEEKDVVPIV